MLRTNADAEGEFLRGCAASAVVEKMPQTRISLTPPNRAVPGELSSSGQKFIGFDLM